MLMAFFVFSGQTAVTISGFSILLGGIVRFILTYSQKHPSKDAVIIEYALVNVMLPTVLIGTLTGVFLNLLLPVYVNQWMMFILFSALCAQNL